MRSNSSMARLSFPCAVAPEDIAKTVDHLMGVDGLQAIGREERSFDLLPEGRVLAEML